MSRSQFDDVADRYDSSLPPHVIEHYLRKRVAFISRHCPRGRVLDVGCGTGVLASRLSAAGYSVVGVEPSRGMVDVLRENKRALAATIGNGTHLPFADGCFDLVYCVAVMHHVAEAQAVGQVISEMVRVARVGGRVLIWDHNHRNPYWPILMRKVPQDTGEERLIPEGEILAAMRGAGARTEYNRQLGFIPDFIPAPLLRPVAALERLVEATPLVRRLCAHNVVLGVK